MEIAIVGNGPSYEEYIEQINRSNFDIIVGCNYPDDRLLEHISYSAFCDASSARLMRIGGIRNDYIDSFKIVIGDRAQYGLSVCKDKPGGERTCLEYFNDINLIESIHTIPTEVLGESPNDEQKYFTSGHLACQFVCETWGSADISIFGMDSIFNGNHRDSLSNVKVHEGTTIEHAQENSPGVVNKWRYNWNALMDKYINKIIFFGPDKQILNMRN